MEFIKTIKAKETSGSKAYFLIFNETNHLLVLRENEEQISIPYLDDREVEKLHLNDSCFLGTRDDIPCFCAYSCAGSGDAPLPDQYQWRNLRALFRQIDSDFWEIAEAAWFRADQLPRVPGKPTLSFDLIQWFVKSQQRDR